MDAERLRKYRILLLQARAGTVDQIFEQIARDERELCEKTLHSQADMYDSMGAGVMASGIWRGIEAIRALED